MSQIGGKNCIGWLPYCFKDNWNLVCLTLDDVNEGGRASFTCSFNRSDGNEFECASFPNPKFWYCRLSGLVMVVRPCSAVSLAPAKTPDYNAGRSFTYAISALDRTWIVGGPLQVRFPLFADVRQKSQRAASYWMRIEGNERHYRGLAYFKRLNDKRRDRSTCRLHYSLSMYLDI